MHDVNDNEYIEENELDFSLPDITESEQERLDLFNDIAALTATAKSHTEHRKLTLRPYQEDGVDFALMHKRSLNTDEWGLGKTAQGAEWAHRVRLFDNTPVGKGRCLIAAPGYLVQQWCEYLRSQYPETTVVNCSTTTAVRGNAKGQQKPMTKGERLNALLTALGILPNDDDEYVSADWVVINHEMVRLFDIPPMFDSLIIDESHHYRNHEAGMSVDMNKLAQRIPNLLLLTATPVIREPDDLYWQLHMIDPNEFNSYMNFCYKYCHIDGGTWGGKVTIRGGYTGKIKSMLEDYAIGRKYRQVHMYLPRLIPNVITLPLPSEIRKRYDMIKAYYIDILADEDQGEKRYYSNAMACMQKLRQITMCDEKIDAVVKLVEDIGPNQDTVVFCWYKSSAHKLQQALQAANCENIIPCITGDMRPDERRQQAVGKHIIVATLGSLSEGVDLSKAKHVVFAEEFFTPGTIDQALARVRRWSENEGSVHVHYVHMERTIDESIHLVQSNRKMTVREIMRDALEM